MTGKTGTIRVVFAILLALLAGTGIAAEDGDALDAISAAERWLTLVDRGDYTESFHEAAASFQQGSSPQNWEQVLRSDREPEGSVVSRKVNRSVHRVGPLGRDNVEIWYETSFQNRRSAVERVYTRHEQDGQWRVTGYIIDAGELGLGNILMALLLAAVIIVVFLREVKLYQRSASDVQNDSYPEQDGPRQ